MTTFKPGFKIGVFTFSFSLALLLFIETPISGTAVAQEDEFAGEKVVHLLDEPRHRTVHNEGDLYLLDVQINPGDISFAHTHDQAILLTTISTARGFSEGIPRANIDYATTPLTHKVSNDGPGLLRIMAFVNAGSGNSNLSAGRPAGISEDPVVENTWFRSYRLELAPGEETPILNYSRPTVAIQVLDGLLHVTREDGITSELDARADWAWHRAGQSFSVRNVGTAPTAVVISEGR